MSELALREDREGVAIVTLNRPERLNAMNLEMRNVIFQAVEELRDRSDLRVLLIRAHGRYFTAGVDIRESSVTAAARLKMSMVDIRRDYRRGMHVFLDEMEAVEKPIVMAIHGPCLGLGVEMAGAADFRLASEGARFGLPEIDIGLLPGSGGTSRFTRLCGPGWAKWLIMAGEQIDAPTALAAGFVQAVWPDETFEDEVWRFCQRLQLRPAEVQGVAKLAIELAYDLDRSQARHIERIVNTPLMMRDNSELVANVLNRNKKREEPNA
jgi:enoyl-CoA hydratase/carnithine racemase